MKKLKKIYRFFIGTVALVFAFSVFSCHKQKSMSVAFYNLPQNYEDAVKSQLESSFDGIVFSYFDFDPSIPLSEQQDLYKKELKKVSIIFAKTDADAIDFANESNIVKKVSSEYLSGMPISVISSINHNDNKVSRIPFLYDMTEIDVNYNFYKKTSVKELNLWSDLIQVAQDELSTVDTPIVFAYKDDAELLNVFGQMIEVFTNYSECENFYNSLYEIFKDYRKNGETALNQIPKLFEENKSAQETIFQLRRMMNSQNGTLKHYVKDLTSQDALFYADNKFCGMYFTTLSGHRKISQNVISEYRSVYFPAFTATTQRKFTAQEFCIIPLDDSEQTVSVIADFCNLKQTQISTATGLAPVQKSCQTADKQADDVRFWITASSGPLHPLSTAVPESKALSATATALRNLLEE